MYISACSIKETVSLVPHLVFPTRGYSPLDGAAKYQKSNVALLKTNVMPRWLEFDWLICLLRNFARRYKEAAENDASITEHYIPLAISYQ